MTRFLNPRSVYLASLGLLAVGTVDLWRRIRKHDTNTAVPQQDVVNVPAIAPAPKPATTPKPSPRPAPSTKTKSQPASQPSAEVTEAVTEVVTEVAAVLPTPQPSASATKTTAARTPTGDDLTKLTGIGPTYAKRLKDAGLTSFADVANASAAQLQEITRATGSAADPAEWIREARALKGK